MYREILTATMYRELLKSAAMYREILTAAMYRELLTDTESRYV
jgi:hypothetical protein